MERRNLALLCAGVLCFWLFALAFGTAEGRGVAVQAELPTAAPAAVALGLGRPGGGLGRMERIQPSGPDGRAV